MLTEENEQLDSYREERKSHREQAGDDEMLDDDD